MSPDIFAPFVAFSAAWDTWSPNITLRATLLTLNAVSCAAMVPACIILIHFTQRVTRKLALSMLACGAFGYLLGVLYGIFAMASPVSTLLHLSMALALWSFVPVIRERNKLRNRA